MAVDREGVACNISLQLTPWALFWFEGVTFAGVRFALVIRRRN
jgi:hypothetical protein